MMYKHHYLSQINYFCKFQKKIVLNRVYLKNIDTGIQILSISDEENLSTSEYRLRDQARTFTY